jgi:hypothetical protein
MWWLADVGVNVGLAAVAGALAAAAGAAAAEATYGPSPRFPPGFTWLRDGRAAIPLTDAPSSRAPVIGYAGPQTRVMYTDVVKRNGQTYYFVHPPLQTPGWVSEGDTSPPPPWYPKPIILHPKDITGAKAGMIAGASG